MNAKSRPSSASPTLSMKYIHISDKSDHKPTLSIGAYKNILSCVMGISLITFFLLCVNKSSHYEISANQREVRIEIRSPEVPKFPGSRTSDARSPCGDVMFSSSKQNRQDVFKGANKTKNILNKRQKILKSPQVKSTNISCDSNELLTFTFGDLSDWNMETSIERERGRNNMTCPRDPVKPTFHLPKTGLVSFPGSGNTWLRHLLQQMTGLLTGSVYSDSGLKHTGFPGEGLQDNVVVVKSHSVAGNLLRLTSFERQILLLRNPYDAIMAEYKRGRMKLGHIGDGTIIPDIKWTKYVKTKIQTWSLFVLTCLDFPGQQHIVFYEDLTQCLEQELKLLAMFLKTDQLTQFSVCCTLQNREGKHHRRKFEGHLKASELYNSTLKKDMNAMLSDVAIKVHQRFPVLAQRILGYRLK